jgi:Trypsin.
MSSEGDSGGPVFNSNYAWGIVSGQYGAPWCICDLIYTPVDYVQSGLGILISIQ